MLFLVCCFSFNNELLLEEKVGGQMEMVRWIASAICCCRFAALASCPTVVESCVRSYNFQVSLNGHVVALERYTCTCSDLPTKRQIRKLSYFKYK